MKTVFLRDVAIGETISIYGIHYQVVSDNGSGYVKCVNQRSKVFWLHQITPVEIVA